MFSFEADDREEADRKLSQILKATSAPGFPGYFSHVMVDDVAVDHEWENLMGDNVWDEEEEE